MEFIDLLVDVLLVLREFHGEAVDLTEHDPAERGDGGEREKDDEQGGGCAGKTQTFKHRRRRDEQKGEKSSEGEGNEDLAAKVDSGHDEKGSQECVSGRLECFTNICRHGSPARYDAENRSERGESRQTLAVLI
jgi:hypothetical protein